HGERSAEVTEEQPCSGRCCRPPRYVAHACRRARLTRCTGPCPETTQLTHSNIPRHERVRTSDGAHRSRGSCRFRAIMNRDDREQFILEHVNPYGSVPAEVPHTVGRRVELTEVIYTVGGLLTKETPPMDEREQQ